MTRQRSASASDKKLQRRIERARDAYRKADAQVATARARLGRAEAKVARRATRLAQAEETLTARVRPADTGAPAASPAVEPPASDNLVAQDAAAETTNSTNGRTASKTRARGKAAT